MSLAGWRTVETALGYLESGVVGSRTVRLYDALGGPLSTSAYAYGYDANGRLSTETLNGGPFATYGYGGNGELTSATFASGDAVGLAYDPLTRRWTGSAQTTPAYAASTYLRMSDRGLVDSEVFTAGATSLTRTYDYSAQRFLTSTLDGRHSYGYGFDGFGLPTYIARNGTARFITRSGSTLTAGSVTYTFDGLGRTIQRGPLTLFYGPDGHVATASRGAGSWSLWHDETGNRLLKLAGSTPVAAYVEEGYLDATGLTERVQVAGRTVGLLRNGAFTTVATDARGSVIAETDGTARVASAFGQRDVHPSMAAALDYVEKGYDADLGLVRMGVRDYDPEINRFTTPDPLFLEQPGRCVESPVQCSLYGYALNLPNLYSDPTGEQARPPRYGPMVRNPMAEILRTRYNRALEEINLRDPLTRRDYISAPNWAPTEGAVYRIEAQVRTLRALQEPPLGLRSLENRPSDGLADLAKMRRELGLKPGEGALARLDIAGRSFYGINAHGQEVTLRVNPISRTHAEADVFQQAANAGISAPRARLTVDRPTGLCEACGTNGAVNGMARQLGIETLEVATPKGTDIMEVILPR